MEELRSVLLLHRVGDGHHYDWMIEQPGTTQDAAGQGDDDDARTLLTWRVAVDSPAWAQQRDPAGRPGVAMEQLPAHRRVYLWREGPIGDGRGEVQRVDEGRVRLQSWGESGGQLEVQLRGFAGLVQLQREAGDRWFMRIMRSAKH